MNLSRQMKRKQLKDYIKSNKERFKKANPNVNFENIPFSYYWKQYKKDYENNKIEECEK